MERKGLITARHTTNNQCKDKGHNSYEYYAKLVFEENTPLDKNKFLVDHTEVDQSIQESTRSGSCEQMHDSIMVRLQTNPKFVHVVAIKVTIIPVYPSGMANLTKVWVKNKLFIKYLAI